MKVVFCDSQVLDNLVKGELCVKVLNYSKCSNLYMKLFCDVN